MRDINNPYILQIQNYHKMTGEGFWNNRFICTNSIENETLYRFQFADMEADSKRYLWVEILRIPDWDGMDKKWVHRLNYPKCPKHIVTSEYLSDFRNAVRTMGIALNESM